jgi:hypothetical protein
MRYPKIGEKMKFTLKNFPIGDYNNIYEKWKEGFEKELRAMKTSGVYESNFDRELIEEILGE